MDRASAGAEGLGLDHTKPAFFDVRNIAAGRTARKRGVAPCGILWWWNERAAQACGCFHRAAIGTQISEILMLFIIFQDWIYNRMARIIAPVTASQAHRASRIEYRISRFAAVLQ